jgi:hypothetical protein
MWDWEFTMGIYDIKEVTQGIEEKQEAPSPIQDKTKLFLFDQ